MQPNERVEAYLRAWHTAWKITAAETLDFAVWGGRVAQVDRAHFAPGRRSDSAGSFRKPPTHDPAVERVTAVHRDGGTATVETTAAGTLTTYFEYDLVEVDGDWRITQVLTFLRPADAPCVTAAAWDAVRAAPTDAAALDPLPPDWVIDGDRLFTPGRAFERGGARGVTEVREVGALEVVSGVLAVRDLGYDVYELPVLRRRVPVGRFPVDVVELFGRIAAVRVRFADALAASWHPAVDTAGGDAVGVDAGDVAIVDAASLALIRARRRERVFDGWVRRDCPPEVLSLARPDDGVLVPSGWGDGVYPMWWGADATGELTALVVDFQLAATVVDGVYRH